jgi:hypothetical protein
VATKAGSSCGLSFDRLGTGLDTPFGSFPLASGCPIEESRYGQNDEKFFNIPTIFLKVL